MNYIKTYTMLVTAFLLMSIMQSYASNCMQGNCVNGQGTMTFPSGEKYVGEFRDSNYHGQGIFTLSNGSIQKGVWANNVLVKPEATQVAAATTTTTIKAVPSDTTPPQIEITSHQTRRLGRVKEETATIEGRATDASGVNEVTVNGTTADLESGGKFAVEVALAPGSNQIIVAVVDTKGNRGSKTFTIVRESSQPVIAASNTGSEKRIALVIGNGAYTKGGSLANPARDARAIADSLRGLGFEVFERENLSQRDMKIAIDSFGGKLKQCSVGLFYYAGHGIQVKGSNYLIPVDAEVNSEKDVELDCMDAGRVLARMEEANSKTNIIILDACRDNPFERSWSRAAKGSGLASMNAPPGSIIAYATQPGNTASDGTTQNSPYASALLDYMHTPGITVLQMFQKVRSDVMKKSSGRQIPWEATSLQEDFYFKK